MDLPTDIKFIKLNLLLHFRGLISFEVQSYEVQSHSRFGPFRGSVQFEVRSFSRFGHSRFGHFRALVIRGSVQFKVQSFEVRSFEVRSFDVQSFEVRSFEVRHSRFGHGFAFKYLIFYFAA
jgi:hypothetical protein